MIDETTQIINIHKYTNCTDNYESDLSITRFFRNIQSFAF